jgi:hypothetical protein
MWLTGKCIMHMGIEDPVRVCYEWQRCCINFKCWANTLNETKRVETQHTFGRISIKIKHKTFSKMIKRTTLARPSI